MTAFSRNVSPFVSAELLAAAQAEAAGSPQTAFTHLERAHVVGQAATAHHVRVHWLMLQWGQRQRNYREVLGQMLRIVGAATKTFIGFIPNGNTGGANVSAIKPLPIPPDLQAIIQKARI